MCNKVTENILRNSNLTERDKRIIIDHINELEFHVAKNPSRFRTERAICQDAIDAQSACNSTALGLGLHEAGRYLFSQGCSTDQINAHPAIILFAAKILSLSGWTGDSILGFTEAAELKCLELLNPHSKSKLKQYAVDIMRTGYGFRTLTVQASSEKEAIATALDIAGNYEFSEKSSEYECPSESAELLKEEVKTPLQKFKDFVETDKKGEQSNDS